LPKPLLSVAHAPDTDGMSLLDYAASQFSWHQDWPEARPSVWHELPVLADFDPALPPVVSDVEVVTIRPEYAEMHLGIPVPMPVEHYMAAKAPHLNYCGGCFQRFEVTAAVTAASALRYHIEAEPCAHYSVTATQTTLTSST
jgi:hypothetical protein